MMCVYREKTSRPKHISASGTVADQLVMGNPKRIYTSRQTTTIFGIYSYWFCPCCICVVVIIIITTTTATTTDGSFYKQRE